ncbi:hypothetical protein MF625_000987 [Paenibacillus polymyxa]|uniref:hypothetical protein n=1 Tax=Paenibacillus polymyxa TaxID=1406 RepID=UPI0020251DEE|nr:hypothetical protein [Paenibacillus polymyxa]URJ36569.1 hypothetical protein MF625_000987 [Paenibacillus polymyxa]
MNRADVMRLFIVISESYPVFDVSEENVERHLKYLRDIPLDIALQNVDKHIPTSKFYPGISEIRGQFDAQAARQRELEETRVYLDERKESRKQATLPPPGWREAIIARLRD